MEKKKRRSVFQQVFQGCHKAQRRRHTAQRAGGSGIVTTTERTAVLKMDWQIQGLPNN